MRVVNGSRVACGLVLVAVLAVAALPSTTSAAGASHARATEVASGPALLTDPAALAGALRCPDGLAHADKPVALLLHGTGTTGEATWPDGLGLVLHNAGYDWCMVTIPGRELTDIQTSTEYVVYAVRALHAFTGRRVDMVGHSQGADELRWAVRFWPDVRADVDDLITVEGANRGIPEANVLCALGRCDAPLWQFSIGSHFMAALNRVPPPSGPSYTAIGSLTDELVPVALPLDASPAFIPSPAASNIWVQQLCPGRPVDHVQATWDAAELAIVMDAIEHPGPAVEARVDKAACGELFAPGIDTLTALGDIAALYASAALPTVDPLGNNAVPHEPELRPYAQ